MKIHFFWPIRLLMLGSILWQTVAYGQSAEGTAAFIAASAEDAQNLLMSFNRERRADMLLRFDDTDRQEWSNLPINEYPRKGIPLKEMDDTQRRLVQQLLRTSLSDLGYLQINWIFWNDERRKRDREKANNPTALYYGHNNYWVTIFGNPSATENWAWQLEGHHLSINVSFVDGKVATTPLFLGADPAVVPDGPFAGLEILDVPSNTSRELMQSLNEDQQQQALVSEELYADILTRTGDEPHTQNPAGLPVQKMSNQQQQMLRQIIEHYVNTFEEAAAQAYLADWKNGLPDDLTFAWSGSTDSGAPVYYRIQSADFLIEYDNRSGEPNHIHSVWYDLKNKFGQSFLGME
ncbi:DUF3500 domain-containing protein [Tunicatimonas pelagia]|uniref:DUF3500 domain-containing protein n=1 Tax=Tunicatimonas pelagia TaxID=931531 RepID=UPI0026663B28|nr:DUF3500 domain-containing protein [Tunicatimonas pelagia]WKN42429.1 DUF3500 domain-containing protein [Tunicatimonas pelagia]